MCKPIPIVLPKALEKDRGEEVAVAAICSKVYAARAYLAAKDAVNEPPSETAEGDCCSIKRCATLSAAAITAAIVAAAADKNAQEALAVAQRKIGDEPSASMAAAVACLEPNELDEAVKSNSSTSEALAEAVVRSFIRKKKTQKDEETQAGESMIAPASASEPAPASVSTDSAVDGDDDNIVIDEVE